MPERHRVILNGHHTFIWFFLLTGCISLLNYQSTSAFGKGQKTDISDEDITVAIESRFLVDKSIPANFIDVETNDGIVTLSGRSTNLLAKDRAGQIVNSVRGVKALINTIQVNPGIPFDDEHVKRHIRLALAADPAADSYELTVTVENGVTTLEGSVESWAEKQLSEEVAKSVKGVKELKSLITVKPTMIRSDSEIEKEVYRRLQSDVWVREKLIGVIVDRGQVSLTGTVGSLEEKYAAFTDAWVLGVTSVNVEQLEVKWWAHDRMHRTPDELVASQSQIREVLQSAFATHPRIKGAEISIDVTGGTAILTGIVSNLLAKQAAEYTARNTVGIWRVRNLIKVRPPNRVNDKELKERIAKALNDNPIVDRYDIKISSKNGVVSISGYIDSPTAIAQAVQTVAKVRGVAKVVDNPDYVGSSLTRSDEKIGEEIRRAIWWDPLLYDQPMNVEVKGGIVTIKGKVPSIIEWRRAYEIAKESGAKRVRNQLKVKYGPDFLTG